MTQTDSSSGRWFQPLAVKRKELILSQPAGSRALPKERKRNSSFFHPVQSTVTLVE